MLDYLLHSPTAAYFLMIVAAVLAMIASANVNSTFKKYDKINSIHNVQANVIARQILDSYGLYDVQVVHVNGKLSDHYNPKTNTVGLSDSTFFSSSVAAIGVAAHEVGHAVQHAKGYMPIKIRNVIFPIVQFGSQAWLWIFLIGIIFTIPMISVVGILFFAVIVVFQLVTLPVEFDASRRAIDAISSQNLLEPQEIDGAKKTLRAAAMTYVASLLVSITQLIRLIATTNRRR